MNRSKRAKGSSAKIEVFPAAPEQQQIVANLLELYAHDFSDFLDVELGEDGRFGYKDLPLYWREETRHPFLVRVDGRLAGLILLKQGSQLTDDQSVWDMAEFFVIRGYRGRGVGTAVAHEVWRRFPGRWEIRVMQANKPARQFWEHAIKAYAGDAVQSSCVKRNGEKWRLFSFHSAPRKESRL